MLARIPPESLGAYVITMAAQPSDVLAVELLQQQARRAAAAARRAAVRNGAATSRAPATSSIDLLSMPWYRDRAAAGRRRK